MNPQALDFRQRAVKALESARLLLPLDPDAAAERILSAFQKAGPELFQ